MKRAQGGGGGREATEEGTAGRVAREAILPGVRPRALVPAIVLLVAAAPSAGCSAPAALKPLSYDPPAAARQTFTYSEDRALRYNGHYRFVTPEGEVLRQLAGDRGGRDGRSLVGAA